jgi:hypothetical protein
MEAKVKEVMELYSDVLDSHGVIYPHRPESVDNTISREQWQNANDLLDLLGSPRLHRTKSSSSYTCGSYGLKHLAEDWASIRKKPNYYVPNGVMILAGLHRGFITRSDLARSAKHKDLNVSFKFHHTVQFMLELIG